MNKMNYKCQFLCLSVICLAFTGCISNKKIAYFQDIQNVKKASLDSAIAFTEPVIQPDDILSIDIFTLSPQSGSIINQAASIPTLGGNTNTSLATQSTGFLVDKNGEIELSLIGKLKVIGLTTYQARELIRDKAAELYKQPNVQLRFANFKVSVLGEVNRPSVYTFPNEKVTILDALSLAGDLTIYGKRDNIMVVRDNNGTKEFGRLNLSSSDVFSNPLFYLKQNDVIYIEPNNAKASTNNAGRIQTIGIITSVLSVLILAVSVLK